MASHRRSPQPGLAARTTRVTVLSAAAAATAALSGAAAQFAAADPGGAGDSASRVDDLYQQAEQATEAYDAAQERTQRLRAELGTLQDRAARGQQRVNELRDELGVVAASQYRDGGIDPSLDLLLSDDPASYLDRLSTLDRLGGQQAGELRQLQSAERVLHQQRDQAAGKLTELDRAGAALRRHKHEVQHALASAQRLLAGLPAAQRARLLPGGDQRASRDRVLPDIPDLPAPTGRAALAVAAARRVLGAPYVWGATGPNAFDCSGLMLYAYRQAGVELPRTSQEQMNAGPHVPLDQARPGDLVIYRGDASHVAMYVGGGMVIHAPYPGARVRYDPVDMMPVTAVTRP
ncbi:C40 family peptidase [Actinacidiphila acidipaludis]|uniref:C40 family peptidase n=1 Tax=Actinacidiphila acidipaludis TaxID=2873382 RepID=A0ABS7Q0W3_9ACTN|nr:C40 family peptidase [Streptomyces acidipaludis]MBY8876526.1 C40 family peptidase [Streptomyces acidipaludis]